jgi:opacity protein-like surface antigen
MKRAMMLGLVITLISLFAGKAKAELYLEGYIGGNFPIDSPSKLLPRTHLGWWFDPGLKPNHINPALIGGIKIGTWFVKEGLLGFNYPEWMKYLGFYVDFGYHPLNFSKRATTGKVIDPYVPYYAPSSVTPLPYTFESNGGTVTMAFMLALRYGFLPDRDVPFGRLQPYAAVGPAILLSWQKPTFSAQGTPPLPLSKSVITPDISRRINIGMAVEAGLRWTVFENVSMDISCKYRFLRSRYEYTISGEFYHSLHCTNWLVNYNLLNLQVGLAYYF